MFFLHHWVPYSSFFSLKAPLKKILDTTRTLTEITFYFYDDDDDDDDDDYYYYYCFLVKINFYSVL